MQLPVDPSPILIDRPQTFEDMSGRERFQAPLDHTQHALKAVLSDYHFQRQAPCGLQACRKLHNTGFLVVTESGVETNIGQYCGRKHFGEEVFLTARADHQRLRDRADLVKRARALQAEAPAITARIDDLMYTRAFGGKWVTAVRKELYAVIGSLFDSLEVVQTRGDFSVKEYRQRTDKEIEDLMASNKGLTRAMARDATVNVGAMEPMPWITFDFRRRLVLGIQEPLQSFSTLDPSRIESPKLKEMLKPFEGHAKELEEAEAAAASAIRFLADDNLRLVALWFPEHHRAKADDLRNWIGTARHRSLLSGNA